MPDLLVQPRPRYGVYRSLYPAVLSQQHMLARFPSGG
jgi:hypothetical protein